MKYKTSIIYIACMLIFTTGIIYLIYTQKEDATLEWKTYSNNEYGFSFKYPNDWKVVDEKNEGISDQFKSVTISKINSNQNDSYKISFTKKLNATEQKQNGSTIKLAGNIWTKSTFIDGTPGDNDPYESELLYTYIPSENSDFSIVIYPILPDSDARKIELDNLYSYIVSTFKFTK